jgi:O-antigen/teichoic acid export membrane protein
MKLRKKDMNFGCIKELLSSGVWSLVNKLNSLLADGLDLLITNAFIGPLQMGAMALSKTIPTMFYTLRGTLDYPFAPPMTECYAKGDIEGTIRNVRLGNKVLGVLIIAPIAAFILYGISFFKLWVPGEDYVLIYILSILSMLSLLASSCVNSTYTLLTVINRIRFSAIVSLITGLLTLLINFILLKTTNLGVYAIAGTSSILALLKHYFINPLYIAHCLKLKKSTFYHEILTGNLCLVVNLAVGFLFTRFLGTGNTWISLILSAGSFVVVGIIINFFIVFSKNERNAVFSAVRRKLKRG